MSFSPDLHRLPLRNPKNLSVCHVKPMSNPRSFTITRKDLVNYGYTLAFPGCYGAANDRKHKPHTSISRERIAKALAEDDPQAHRIIDAREREDAYLENTTRETDIDRNEKVNGPAIKNADVLLPPTPTGPPAPSSQDEPVSNSGVNASITREDLPLENNFHDVVNNDLADQEMYDEIRSLPSDAETWWGQSLQLFRSMCQKSDPHRK